MKINCILLLFLTALLNSCSNDLDIAADYKETTIVYGLLNQADPDTHYVQVFRGFLDENTNALDIAKNPDSIYYDGSVEVKLNDGSQEHILERIAGPNRNEGIFVDSPNYVYRFIGDLNENSVYKLTVTNQQTNHIVTAQTPVVKDFSISRPDDFIEINLATDFPNDVQWQAAENGKVYQCIMRFFYKEWNLASGDTSSLFVDWVIFNNFISQPYHYTFDGTAFLAFLGSRLSADQNIRRIALDAPLEFRFFVGADDLYEYIRVNGAQTGITSLQVQPEYTNVTNGLGIFSSRYFKSLYGIKINSASFDSLSCGVHTKKLNFVNRMCD